MIPRTETHASPDISPIIDLGILYNPSLATADISTIYMWVNEGCDIEKDILPTLKALMAKKKGITRFHYWTNPIREAKDKRLIASQQIAQAKSHPTEYYIEIYRWKRRMGLPLMTDQERALDEADKRKPSVVNSTEGAFGF